MKADELPTDIQRALSAAKQALLDTEALLGIGKPNDKGKIEFDAHLVGRLDVAVNRAIRQILPFT